MQQNSNENEKGRIAAAFLFDKLTDQAVNSSAINLLAGQFLVRLDVLGTGLRYDIARQGRARRGLVPVFTL